MVVLWPWLQQVVLGGFHQGAIVAFLGVLAALVGLLQFSGVNRRILAWTSPVQLGCCRGVGRSVWSSRANSDCRDRRLRRLAAVHYL